MKGHMSTRALIILIAVAVLISILGCIDDATVDKIQHENDVSVHATTEPIVADLADLLPPPVNAWVKIGIGLWPPIEKLVVNPLWDLTRKSTTQPTAKQMQADRTSSPSENMPRSKPTADKKTYEEHYSPVHVNSPFLLDTNDPFGEVVHRKLSDKLTGA